MDWRGAELACMNMPFLQSIHTRKIKLKTKPTVDTNLEKSQKTINRFSSKHDRQLYKRGDFPNRRRPTIEVALVQNNAQIAQTLRLIIRLKLNDP